MKNIVKWEKCDAFATSWDLSRYFEVEHRRVFLLIQKYKSEFDSLGFITFSRQRITGKKGGQINEYLLNETQSLYLLTLLNNKEKVRKFKHHLVQQFTMLRHAMNIQSAHKLNEEWRRKRKEGKEIRNEETDTIKEFVSYAESQGSKNASKYYMVITKMENHALFAFNFLNQKFPNLRDLVNTRSLNTLMTADRIVAKCLRECMQEKIPYKEIYQEAKRRVEEFSTLIGQTPIEQAIGHKLPDLIA